MCLDVLKSQCSKSSCIIDGKKPVMIAAPSAPSAVSKRATNRVAKRAAKRKFKDMYGDDKDEEDDDQEEPEEVVHSNETESEEESGLSEISDDASDDDVSNNDDSNDDDALTSVREAILETWRSLSPECISEKSRGKWYAIIYSNAKKPMMHIGKVEKRWLYDEGGEVTHIDFHCLKPKSRSGTVLEETPKHLGKYSDKIPLIDIIAGPLQVEPLKGNKINVPVYQDVLKVFGFIYKTI